MTLTAVLFDLDGALFDHHRSAVDALRTWCERVDRTLSPALVDAWFASETVHYQAWLDGTISRDEQRRRRLRDFLPLLGLPVPADADLDALYADGFLAAYEAAWCGYDDAAPTLADLRAAGLRVGVLTNGATAQQNAKLRALGLVVDVVVTSEEIGCAKPDPRAFRTACARLGVGPERTVYVGDDPVVDVLGARSAGLRAVHLERTGATGAHRIASLGELPALLRDMPAAREAMLPGPGRTPDRSLPNSATQDGDAT